MEKEKPETIAERFIRERRMRYSEMYPTNFHLLLRLVESRDDNWDEEGKIVCTYNEGPTKNALTDEGWKSYKNVSRCPTSWPMPNDGAPMFNIPDNAENSWLQEIGMFLYHLDNWNPEYVETWITTSVKLGGMGETYQKDAINRNIKGYRAVREAVKQHQVAERIRLIQTERYAPKVERKPIVEVGATVRFHTGVDTTTVEKITDAPASRHRKDDGIIRLAFLKDSINGSNVHLVENLIATDFPPQT